MVSRVKNVIRGSESLEMTRIPKVPEIPHLEDDVAECLHLRADTSPSMRDDGRDHCLARGGTHVVARSITWDQGKEMAEHVRFTVETGLQIYFCDPKSPWRRWSNENTNGLLSQYLPKSSDLSQATQRELDAIARSLHTKPRQTLGWMTPSQAFAETVALTP